MFLSKQCLFTAVTDDRHAARLSLSLNDVHLLTLLKVLAHSVHLGIAVWTCAAIFTLLFYLIMRLVAFDPFVLAWVWAGAGVLKFILANTFDLHMVDIMHAQAVFNLPSASDHDTECKSLINGHSKGVGGDLPPWCHIDMDAYNQSRSWLIKALAKDVQPNRQDALHWFERDGPEYDLLFFQASLVSTAIYGAVLLLTFLPLMYVHSSLGNFALYLVISTAPVLVSQRQRRNIASHITQANCVGTHRKPQSVNEVHLEAKTTKAVRGFIMVDKLLYAADNDLFMGCEHSPKKARRTMRRGSLVSKKYYQRQNTTSEDPAFALGPVERGEIEELFEGFDPDGSGCITPQELEEILVSLGGVSLSADTMKKIIEVLDEDGNGEIDKEEFLNFYARNIYRGDDPRSTVERARDMFAMFDQSKDGQITIGEFKAALDALNYGFTVDEVGALVRELDADESGTITIHEFEQLLCKYEAQLAPYTPRELPVV